MIEQVECPCCSFQADFEVDYDDPDGTNQRLRDALREHVLWTHYRTGDWGKAPSGGLAAALFLALGVLDQQEAARAHEQSFRKEVPRPNWYASSGHWWLITVFWFFWGSLEMYLWQNGSDWWLWVAPAVVVSLFPLLGYLSFRRVWKGHPSRRQQRRLQVPDTIPEDE